MGYRSEGHETIGLLAGCVMDPWFARVHEATIALFEHAGFGVVVPESQTCCGALAAHEGMATEASSMAMLNEVAFEGVDHVVANAAGCSAHLTGYEHWGAPSIAVRSVDAIALVADAIESGRLGRVSDERGPVAVHDPCHHRHAQGVHTETRDVLHAAGYELRDLDPSGMCCGAAGMYSLARPGAADALGANKAAQFAATGCDIVASGNPGCEMQLRSHITERVRVAHPLELYAEALGLLAIPRSG
jgi:glycolate oxidase iron-sulfur subunit